MSVGDQSWTFNPACLTAYQRDEEANLMTTENAKESKSETKRMEMSGLSGVEKCNMNIHTYSLVLLSCGCFLFLPRHFDYCVGETVVSEDRIRPCRVFGYLGSTQQCSQSSGAPSEVPRQGKF